ncbi:DUF3592 domain-containing protein [Asanoa sp. WMMD1127]|uniref:DUF3592 domain-containing protein n=1 Tax=Asanoa sp. WMMD1127 TaxID=3016107 RepID=UPI002417C91E|nr:DUF3592 domain-containing protein [Asanoa sp. WMMD1127]MDG4825222.1 DUF3592 domain-containing protein [Asanoa sp. WMMD1127]
MSFDSTVRIEAITINPLLDEWPDPPVVDARVSGPDADTARSKREQIGLQLFGALFFLGVGGLGVTAWWRGRRAAAAVPLTAPEPVAHPAFAAPAAMGHPRPNRVVWRIVAGWLGLVVAVVVTSWSLDRWNLREDARYAAAAEGTVTADRLGAERRIEVSYPGGDGSVRTVRLTPVTPADYPVGTKVPIRYLPDSPEEAIPADQSPFAVMPRSRTFFAGALIAIGFVFVVAWTWRLLRWVLGAARRRTEPMAMAVLTAEFVSMSAGPSAFWVILTDREGTRWHQRVLWDRRLLEAGAGDRAVLVRRCPGFRRMYLVDVPGVGRLLPASTARRRPPRNYVLTPFDLRDLRSARPSSRLLRLGAGLMGVGGIFALFAGPATGVLAVVLVLTYLLWSGAVPWRGFAAGR